MMNNGFINFIMFGKIFGLKNLALFYCKKWTSLDLPFSMPVFGMISHMQELQNIRDNILKGSVRDADMEMRIRNAGHPVIVDCGINVGVTVRWWFYLNPQATVYGVDMMQEANDFTMKALPDSLKRRYVPITAVLASRTGSAIELNYDDPLFGGNNAGIVGEYSENRQVRSSALDDCLQGYHIDTIDLLKVDIEDSAASMLQGASRTLLKVRTILVEIHSEKEREGSICLLREKGFRIRRSYRRHIWLENTAKNACLRQ